MTPKERRHGALLNLKKRVESKSMLVNYAYVNGDTLFRLIGLITNRGVIFDFQFPNTECSTSWNALPIPLGHMRFE